MKQLIRILCFGLLVWTALTLGVLYSARAQEEVYSEKFDDPDPPGWEFSPSSSITGGYLHLGPEGTAQPPISIENAEINLQIRRMAENGLLAVHYRQSEKGSYQLRLQGSQISLLRERLGEEIILAEGNMELPASTWVSLQIVIQGEEHQVAINEINLSLTARDPDPLEQGGMLFRTDPEMEAQLDDLEIRFIYLPAGEDTEVLATPPASPILENMEKELPDIKTLSWQRLGGPPGGLGYDIRMRPDNPDVMFVTDSHAGIHKSVDGGRSWQPVNEGIIPFSGGLYTVFSATIDPHDYDTIWIGTQFTGHVYRSTDNGASWEARDAGMAQEGRSVRGISIDPADPDVIYAGAGSCQRRLGW